jgi:hypothetical protein
MQKDSPKKGTTEEKSIPQMPFDEALRKLINSPPQHKEQKKEQKKTGK